MRYPDQLLGSTTSGSDIGQTTAVSGGKGAPTRSVTTKSRTDEGDDEEGNLRDDVPAYDEHSDAVVAMVELAQQLGYPDQVVSRIRTLLKATSPSIVDAQDTAWRTDSTGVPSGSWQRTDQPGGVATEAPVGGIPLTQQDRELGVVCIGGLRAPLEPTQVELRPRIQLEADAPALAEVVAEKKAAPIDLVKPAEHERSLYERFAGLLMEAVGLPQRGLNPTAPRPADCVRMPPA